MKLGIFEICGLSVAVSCILSQVDTRFSKAGLQCGRDFVISRKVFKRGQNDALRLKSESELPKSKLEMTSLNLIWRSQKTILGLKRDGLDPTASTAVRFMGNVIFEGAILRRCDKPQQALALEGKSMSKYKRNVYIGRSKLRWRRACPKLPLSWYAAPDLKCRL